MKKLIPCMLAGLIITGFFALCITSFLAPSANYIQDTLDPPEEPFYFVDNPDSVVINSGDYLFLSASTNQPDCIYSWESRTSHGQYWFSISNSTSSDGFYIAYNYTYPSIIYRCKAVYNGMTIYSAPCFVRAISSNNIQSSKGLEKSEELEEFEELEELEELEEPVDLEESEVIE